MTQVVPLHTPVFIWGRPEPNLILLFGEGTYEGMESFNGSNHPVVKLNDGREFTIHYQGVWVGEKSHVERTCKQFKGDVLEFDLQAYLAGQRPTQEQRTKRSNGVAENLSEPKTVTDRLYKLVREVKLEQSKILMHQKAIADSTELIERKRAEMATLKNEVLSELAAIDDIPDDVILAAAERIKQQQAAKQSKPQSSEDSAFTGIDHERLAVED